MNPLTYVKVSAFSGMAIGLFLGYGVFDDGMAAVFLCCLFALIGMFLGGWLYGVRYKRAEEATKESLRYDADSCTVTVLKRVPENKGRFHLEEVKVSKQSYTPEKLVYTSVSGGSVTVGGFHVEGGKTTHENQHTSRYKMWFGKYYVKNIKLADSVLQQAKRSPISKYLDGDCLIIEKSEYAFSNYVAKFVDTFGYESHQTFNASQDAEAFRYLARYEADEILGWLSGEEVLPS